MQRCSIERYKKVFAARAAKISDAWNLFYAFNEIGFFDGNVDHVIFENTRLNNLMYNRV